MMLYIEVQIAQQEIYIIPQTITPCTCALANKYDLRNTSAQSPGGEPLAN